MPEALKFLDAYTKEDHKFYFERIKKVEELYQKVKTNPITLFYGLSGTGKTSLILCGLSNKFHDIDWMSFVIRRGSSTEILTAINNALQPFAKSNEAINVLLNEIYYTNFRPIYLIFDQLEELFIYGDKVEKKAFIDFLVHIKKNIHFVKVILVLREEFFVHLDDFESDIPEIFQSRVRLEPVNEKEAGEIITFLCKAVKLNINEDIIREIIRHISIKPKGFQPDSNFELIEKKIELSLLKKSLAVDVNESDELRDGHRPSLFDYNFADFLPKEHLAAVGADCIGHGSGDRSDPTFQVDDTAPWQVEGRGPV
jgi:hypothetical protein